jgi:hypothetical protein
MKGTIVGTIVSAIGYALAIYGGWILYRNAAPEMGIGRIPVISGKDMTAFFESQDSDIHSRRAGSRTGFLLLTVGSALQLIGTLISGFSPDWTPIPSR